MKCFPSPRSYQLWRESAPPSAIPCSDCRPTHQARMHACGKCEHPDVVFVFTEGEIVGRLPGPDGRLTDRVKPPAEVTKEDSSDLVQVACQLLGMPALRDLIGVAQSSLPHYRNGTRTLPVKKFRLLRAAVRRGAGLLMP